MAVARSRARRRETFTFAVCRPPTRSRSTTAPRSRSRRVRRRRIWRTRSTPTPPVGVRLGDRRHAHHVLQPDDGRAGRSEQLHRYRRLPVRVSRRQTQSAGHDASYSIDNGPAQTSHTNTITGAIAGVTLNLMGVTTTSGPVTVSVSPRRRARPVSRPPSSRSSTPTTRSSTRSAPRPRRCRRAATRRRGPCTATTS